MRAELEKLDLAFPIAIVGLGVSGDSTVKLLRSAGVSSEQICTYDSKAPADFQDLSDMLVKKRPGTLCVSPGIPLELPEIQQAVSSGLRLTSELELAFSFLTSEKVICVTGSVGKSTTTSILGEALKAVDPNGFVGGNLGLPLADYARTLIEGNRNRAHFVVLELSSYQLENFKNLKAAVSVLTNLSPNHMERYRDLNHYYETKMHLFSLTAGLGVLNRNGGDIFSLQQKIQSSAPYLKWTLVDRDSPEFQNKLTQKPALVGSHNLDNLALAFAVADHFQCPLESYQMMSQFPGLPHRLENCGRVRDVLFLNDSKSTSIESVLQAVKSVQLENADSSIHLLLGGKDKNLPWQNLSFLQSQPKMQFHFFGAVGAHAQQLSGLPGDQNLRFKDCLENLKSKLRPGDIVLLSPGGTSWDEFKNFEERGNFFKKWILAEFQSH